MPYSGESLIPIKEQYAHVLPPSSRTWLIWCVMWRSWIFPLAWICIVSICCLFLVGGIELVEVDSFKHLIQQTTRICVWYLFSSFMAMFYMVGWYWLSPINLERSIHLVKYCITLLKMEWCIKLRMSFSASNLP